MNLETPGKEIDNTAMILQLLDVTNEDIIDLVPAKEWEDKRRLRPEFKSQLKQKLWIRNGHSLDYKRIYTMPNV